MFYVPYKFRRQTEYCTPKGPNINRAPWQSFSINGTVFKLKIPRHKTRLPIEPRNPRRNCELQKHSFDSHRTDKIGWNSMALITRAWDFNGPWFIGTRALMELHAVILTPTHVNDNLSFFHPRALESGIADFMSYLYAEKIATWKNNQQLWFAPMNWRPLINLPCIAVQFDAIENKAIASDRMDRFIFVPLSDQHILMVNFPISRNNCYIHSSTIPERDKDQWINNAPMEQLATDIINSLQITLSPEAKQQQEKALAGLTDPSLIKEFPPIKWGQSSDATTT